MAQLLQVEDSSDGARRNVGAVDNSGEGAIRVKSQDIESKLSLIEADVENVVSTLGAKLDVLLTELQQKLETAALAFVVDALKVNISNLPSDYPDSGSLAKLNQILGQLQSGITVTDGAGALSVDGIVSVSNLQAELLALRDGLRGAANKTLSDIHSAFDVLATEATLAALKSRADLLGTEATLALVSDTLRKPRDSKQGSATVASGSFVTVVSKTPTVAVVVVGFSADIAALTNAQYRYQLVVDGAIKHEETIDQVSNSWVPIEVSVAANAVIQVKLRHGEVTDQSATATIAWREI